MPRLSSIRLDALSDLVSDLRYAPRGALLRCIERVESLALEVEAPTTYPLEWIVFRVTGYRPKDAPDEMIVGSALIEDLSALLEHLCDAAGLREDELKGEYASIDDLAERWSVSRKTIERYRRRGLVARRYTGTDGLARLGFAERVAEAFEDRLGERLDRAGAFERIGSDERDWLYRRALRYRERMEWGFATIARRLSEKCARSEATVRRALLRRDEAEEHPVFRVRRKLGRHQSRTIARAMDWGIKPGLIGERFGRSRASVLRIAIDERAAKLREAREQIGPPSVPEGFDPEAVAASVLGTEGARRLPLSAPVLEIRGLLASIEGQQPEDAEREAESAAAHWLLLVRASQRIASLPTSMVASTELDEAETDLRWALGLRRKLVESQIPLVVRSLEERLGAPMLSARPEEIRAQIALAMRATVRAVASFHPVRPDRSVTRFGRLASPVSLALARALNQASFERIRAASGAGRATTARAELEDWTRDLAPWQFLVDAHPALPGALDRLDREEAALLRDRFGLGEHPPRTIARVADMHGVSPARVVSAYRRARSAIRESARG